VSPVKLGEIRRAIEKETELLSEIAERLRNFAARVEAPTAEELRAIEAGEAPMTAEAHLISVLTEQALSVGEAAVALRDTRHATTDLFRKAWAPGSRPFARAIAHLRAGLRGRTLPADFRPEEPLGTHPWPPPAGSALVADLLAKGYRWEFDLPPLPQRERKKS